MDKDPDDDEFVPHSDACQWIYGHAVGGDQANCPRCRRAAIDGAASFVTRVGQWHDPDVMVEEAAVKFAVTPEEIWFKLTSL